MQTQQRGGCVQGTASEAGVVALLAGRSRALAGRPAEDHQRLVAYTSDQVCCCGGTPSDTGLG